MPFAANVHPYLPIRTPLVLAANGLPKRHLRGMVREAPLAANAARETTGEWLGPEGYVAPRPSAHPKHLRLNVGTLPFCEAKLLRLNVGMRPARLNPFRPPPKRTIWTIA